MYVPLATSDNQITDNQFWHSVVLYHNQPHLINRRLLGVSQALFVKVNFSNTNVKKLTDLLTRSAILYETRKLKELSKTFITTDFLKNIFEPYYKQVNFEEVAIESLLGKCEEAIYLSVRVLLPRQGSDNCVEVVVFDAKVKTCTFYGVCEFDKKPLVPPFPYNVQLVSGYLTICIENFEDAESASADWLVDQLFLKLTKWISNYKANNALVKRSLSLVSLEDYTGIYQKLKTKYGKSIVEAWPEKTDPLKFVYEDIAIASYLISLWKRTNPNTKPSFLDLGCGNGLLVYILNEEGYLGEGIDVRKRKIWDWYSNNTLRAETIKPSLELVFSEYDWIIGNHSDELTPWIPVIAAQNSYFSNFFLLPCCAYDFNGEKYKRKDTSTSTYNDYLRYVQSLCKTCGFEIALDKLRIPSTKRTCIVSLGRTYEVEEYDVFKEHIKTVVTSRLPGSQVEIRSSTEKVRNCTQLNREYLTKVVTDVTSVLLMTPKLRQKPDGQSWNEGSALSLPALASRLNKLDLKALKNECGGLQTLLKNHRYIFEVGHGLVKLRIPPTEDETKSKYKSKPCWFHRNHPDGCFNKENICAYLH